MTATVRHIGPPGRRRPFVQCPVCGDWRLQELLDRDGHAYCEELERRRKRAERAAMGMLFRGRKGTR